MSTSALEFPAAEADPCPPLARPSAQGLSAAALVDLTAHQLTQGGDGRITLNARGHNAYGCPSQPDSELIALGSSTASVISVEGFQAAMALHTRLLASPTATTHQREVQGLRAQLHTCLDLDRVPGTALVLAASGTDAHLIAAGLCPGHHATVMGQASETGSGVPTALAARHFASLTSQGHTVRQGELALCIAQGRVFPHAQTPVQVALRHADGRPREREDIDTEVASQVDAALQQSGHCLLVLTDVTKTGLIAPSPACATRLLQRHGDRLDVLVDACQFRLHPRSLHHYLNQGFMVALTGSKFITGPAFCGALLLPAARLERYRQRSLAALRAYSSRLDWPNDWQPAAALGSQANTGLWLRWRAALTEWERLRAVPEATVWAHVSAWNLATTQRLASDPRFELLSTPPLQRGAAERADPSWDSVPSILAFRIRDPRDRSGQTFLGPTDMGWLHRQLQVDSTQDSAPTATQTPAWSRWPHPVDALRVQLGQPVACGQHQGKECSALRVCTSARWIASDPSARATLAATEQALDKLSRLVEHTWGS